MTRNRKLPPVKLPREISMERVQSQYLRSRRLAVKANRDARTMPNRGTLSRKRDRMLAVLSVRAKLAFLKVYHRPLKGPGHLSGAARMPAIRSAARKYRATLARWEAYYRGAISL